MNPPLRIHDIINRTTVPPCPGVQACPSNSPMQDGQPIAMPCELTALVPGAPRQWCEFGDVMQGLHRFKGWDIAAARAAGCKVTLQPGNAGEVLVFPASPLPPSP